MENEYKKPIIISSIILASIVIILFPIVKFNNKLSEENNTLNTESIITYIEDSIQNQTTITNDIEKIEQYLNIY